MKKYRDTKITSETAMEFLSLRYVELYTETKGVIKGSPKGLIADFAQGNDRKAELFLKAVIELIPQGRILYYDTGTKRLETFKARIL